MTGAERQAIRAAVDARRRAAHVSSYSCYTNGCRRAGCRGAYRVWKADYRRRRAA